MIPNKSDVYDTSGKGTFSANGKMPMFIKPVATPQTAAMNQASLRSAIAKAMGAKKISEDPAWDANIPDAATLAQYLHQAQGGNIPPELATFLARYGGGGACGSGMNEAKMVMKNKMKKKISEDWTDSVSNASDLANLLNQYQVDGSIPSALADFFAANNIAIPGGCGMNEAKMMMKKKMKKKISEDWTDSVSNASDLANLLNQYQIDGSIPAALADFFAANNIAVGGGCGANESYFRKGYRLSEDPQWTSDVPNATALSYLLSQVGSDGSMPAGLASFLAQYQGGGGGCGANESYFRKGYRLSEDPQWTSDVPNATALSYLLSQVGSDGSMPAGLASFLAQYQGGGGGCAMSEDYLSSLFNGENLSEDFKFKTKTIFEAAISERVSLIENNILSASKEIIEEQVIANTQQIVEQVDQYLNYVISEWMEENKVAVERGLRTEIAENFINGLKDLFESSFIDVPQEKYNVLDDLFEANNELKENLNGLMKENISLKNEINARLCAEAFMEETSGLADTQVEKLAKLAEGIEFENPDQYRRKVSLLKESYFGAKKIQQNNNGLLTEDMDTAPVLTENSSDPFVSSVANTISVLNKNTPKVEKVYNSPSSARLAGLINPGIAKDSFI